MRVAILGCGRVGTQPATVLAAGDQVIAVTSEESEATLHRILRG
jgi:Trk K+ transport system NAD-binding subunit